MYNYHITTFGCQMNISDSERIAAVLGNVGMQQAGSREDADLIIFNTCSIKQRAEDKVYGHVRAIANAKKRNPDTRFLITGCMVRESGVHERYGASHESQDGLFAMLPPLDCAMRIEDTIHLPQYLEAMYARPFVEQMGMRSSYLEIQPKYQDAYKAYVPIMTGCNKFCTYCIVPYTRKREVSRSVSSILEEIRTLVSQGVVEVTLLGQTVNSYRGDVPVVERHVPNGFVDLLYRISAIPGLQRIYYTSPHPRDMKPELIQAHKEIAILAPYIHLPVQSGSNTVLKRMNRNYTREWYLEIIGQIREMLPHCTLSTDIIVGFDGETEEEFDHTIALYKEADFDFAYISQYSVRKGTYAHAHLSDGVSGEEKRRRWHVLNDLMKEIALRKNRLYEGRTVEVLIDRHHNGMLEGKTPCFKTVHLPGTPGEIGTVLPATVTRGREWLLEAQRSI